jgi:hypothetical protein
MPFTVRYSLRVRSQDCDFVDAAVPVSPLMQ